MSRKLGILTFHYNYINEGSLLQAYCLVNNLKNNLPGYDIEIIDHQYKSKLKVYGEKTKNPRTKALYNFIQNSLPLSKNKFFDDSKKTFKFINENYDALVVGSDEIWRMHYEKKFFLYNPKDPWNPAFPNIYWPDKSVKTPKIAYAACIGNTKLNNIPLIHKLKMKRILDNFSLLSVRDKNTKSFLKWLDPKLEEKAEIIPDPSFSIDISSLVNKKNIKTKLEKLGVDFSKPRVALLFPNYLNDKNTDEAINYFKSEGYQIISLSEYNEKSDIDLSRESFNPLEWIGIFGFMDICISQRMHGCISSILNNIPFIALDSRTINGESKIKDLMRSFNLLDYYWDFNNDKPEKLINICKSILKKHWPSENIIKKRNLFKKRSESFVNKIKNVIE